MSGFNAFSLVNSFRKSIGKNDILKDAPNGATDPTWRDFETLSYIYTDPPKLRATITPPASLSETTYARFFCRGTKYAHLILALYAQLEADALSAPTVDYIADVLPPAATPAWSLIGSERGIISNGQLYIVDPASGSNQGYEQSFSYASHLTAEISIRIISAANQYVMRLYNDHGDGHYNDIYINIYPGQVTWKYKTGAVDTFPLATTDKIHHYRITLAGTDLSLYDGTTLLGTGTAELYAGAPGTKIQFYSLFTASTKKVVVTRVRYLRGAAAAAVQTEFLWDAMRYAQGKELDILPDVYKAQADAMTAVGRFGEPSDIQTVRVAASFPDGLWGNVVWDNLQWGDV
jgi:hypothetical protein